VDVDARASAIALHTVWSQTLGSVTATNTMRDLEDFLRLLERQTVVKVLAWEVGDLVGVAFLTNELDIVPGVSIDFYVARFAAEIEEGSAWYCLSGVVHPGRPGLLSELRTMCAREARRRQAAVLLWDASELQDSAHRRSTIDAVADVYGMVPEPIELDRVAYLGVRLPVDDGVVVDLRSIEAPRPR
jgi:hypothetical protein